MTYAALEATLRSYARGALEEIPALRLIRLSVEEIARRAEALRARLEAELGGRAELRVISGESVVGGGSTPGYALPTKLLALTPRGLSAAELAARLRRHDPPVIVRVEAGRVLLDLRTVFPDQEEFLASALRTACGQRSENRK
jgi:L-seryl-tRNA(Ser) seleniumtransferase